MTKDYIFTVNVCATQILSRKIDDQKKEIELQEERILELERKIDIIIKNM